MALASDEYMEFIFRNGRNLVHIVRPDTQCKVLFVAFRIKRQSQRISEARNGLQCAYAALSSIGSIGKKSQIRLLAVTFKRQNLACIANFSDLLNNPGDTV
ncbi:hypothetical protein CAY53_02105 [Desulfobulbus oralis]|uniref:Uncharacterized protein n=1 Tax=Desulfobulbus oralis TaxID=1986146 RepID=A0A2L1GL93_9BACT|nr:hypothetical protein CAY53_02105 [Desulfobulbus oralis]